MLEIKPVYRLIEYTKNSKVMITSKCISYRLFTRGPYFTNPNVNKEKCGLTVV